MLDALKNRIARHRALKQVRARTVQPWNPSPAARRVLVVLPAGEAAAQEAWRFVKSLKLPPKQIIPVVVSGEVTYVPAEYIRSLMRLEDVDLGRIGLPKIAFAEKVWKQQPEVALCLVPTFDLAAAYLVGASPARFRIGVYDEAAEPFFDLMIAPNDSLASAFVALRETLRRIEPPVLALGPVDEAA